MITVHRKRKDGKVTIYTRHPPPSRLKYRYEGLARNNIFKLRLLLKNYGIVRRYELGDKTNGFQNCKRTKRSRKVPEGEDPEERCKVRKLVQWF